MAIPATSSSTSSTKDTTSSRPASTAEALAEARKTQDFLQLFLAQVTHQDPMEPMKNAELMQQVIGIETVERLGQLDEGLQTLQKVDLAQGASLIGKTVTLADSSTTGRVDRVLFKNGQTMVVVGGKELPIAKVASLELSSWPRSLRWRPRFSAIHAVWRAARAGFTCARAIAVSPSSESLATGRVER